MQISILGSLDFIFSTSQMQNERIKTEEHIEYDSDDSSESGSSSSSKSSHNKLEPEVYKTRKDENFTEYFKIHKNQVCFLKMIYFQ